MRTQRHGLCTLTAPAVSRAAVQFCRCRVSCLCTAKAQRPASLPEEGGRKGDASQSAVALPDCRGKKTSLSVATMITECDKRERGASAELSHTSLLRAPPSGWWLVQWLRV